MVKGYVDLYSLGEDERIQVIGNTASSGKIIGVALENENLAPGKVQRYIDKLAARFPGVRHIKTVPGLSAGTVLVQFGPRLDT